MMDFLNKVFFKAAMDQNVQLQWPRAIAFHLAKNALWERTGAEVLYPDFKDLVLRLIQNMNAIGKPVYLAPKGTTRTAAQQQALLQQVPPVTTVGPLATYHNYGLAADLIFEGYGWNPPDASWWEVLGAEANKLGLIWGGDFPKMYGGTFRDLPHVEWHPGFTHKDLAPFFKL